MNGESEILVNVHMTDNNRILANYWFDKVKGIINVVKCNLHPTFHNYKDPSNCYNDPSNFWNYSDVSSLFRLQLHKTPKEYVYVTIKYSWNLKWPWNEWYNDPHISPSRTLLFVRELSWGY